MWCFLTTLSQSKDGLEFEMCLRPAGPAWQSCPIFQYFFVGAIYHLKKTALIHCQDGSISQYLACEVSHQISQRITQPWQDESFMPGYIFDATSSQPSPKMHWNTWPGTTGPRSSWQNRKKIKNWPADRVQSKKETDSKNHQKQRCKNKFILTQPCKNLGHHLGSGAKADETARPQHRIPAKTDLWNKLCFPNGLVNALCSLNLQPGSRYVSIQLSNTQNLWNVQWQALKMLMSCWKSCSFTSPNLTPWWMFISLNSNFF